jgi:hypothetical protein
VSQQTDRLKKKEKEEDEEEEEEAEEEKEIVEEKSTMARVYISPASAEINRRR